jgi:hypothetical protein
MRIEKNSISNIPAFIQSIDNKSDLPYIPKKPLDNMCKSFFLYVIGSPGSGKTSTIQSLLTSHPTKSQPNKPKYFYKFWDNIFLISGSLQTLSNQFLKLLPDHKKNNEYTDDLLQEIIDELKEGDNDNNLIIIDDCIKSLKKSKIITACALNRRHLTHDPEQDGFGGLSLMVISQKFTLLDLSLRNACSHFMIFKTSNFTELKRIKEEIMYDLTDDEFNQYIKIGWKKPYSFLFIDLNKPKKNKYYIIFDKIIFETDDEDDFEDETIEI